MAFASRGLRGAERNYPDFSSFKLELLALKWAVSEKFKVLLAPTASLQLNNKRNTKYNITVT